MEIQLDLRKHCIATEVKKRYNKSVSSILKRSGSLTSGDETFLEESIELLKTALENLDFPWLRTRYPELAGKTESEVILGGDSSSTLSITIDSQPIKIRAGDGEY